MVYSDFRVDEIKWGELYGQKRRGIENINV